MFQSKSSTYNNESFKTVDTSKCVSQKHDSISSHNVTCDGKLCNSVIVRYCIY